MVGCKRFIAEVVFGIISTESRYDLVGDSIEKLQDDYNLITGVYIGDVLDVHL